MNTAAKTQIDDDNRRLSRWVARWAISSREDDQCHTEPGNPPAPVHHGMGANLEDLAPGALLLATTLDRNFMLRKVGPSELKILGELVYWPESIAATVAGSPLGESVVPPGICLEFQRSGEPPERTSQIRHVWLLQDGPK